jgi:hypothetical protein
MTRLAVEEIDSMIHAVRGPDGIMADVGQGARGGSVVNGVHLARAPKRTRPQVESHEAPWLSGALECS